MSTDGGSVVLIVDDDAAVRKSFSLMLSSKQFTVLTAAGGAEALSVLEKQGDTIGCVLLDIRMSDSPGTEILPVLCKLFPYTPVVMVSANDDLETAIECMRQGAFDYVSKPVSRVVLVETLRKALRHRALELENRRLSRENENHRRHLEETVDERTSELRAAYHALKQNSIETVRVLAETIEAKDSYTRGHCNRVRTFSVRLATLLGFPEKEIENLEYGALLHDIGKIGVPEAILNKNGPLSDEERGLFQKHPVVGETILKPLKFFEPCLPLIRHHHERFDGTGYPDGLSGTAIPPAARVAAVTDAFDAMTSTRSYRPALSVDVALDRLRNGRGSQFDPEYVDTFIRNKGYLQDESC